MEFKFKGGDRVRLSRRAREIGITVRECAGNVGTVLSQKSETAVRVLPDNYRASKIYHVDFWELDGTDVWGHES